MLTDVLKAKCCCTIKGGSAMLIPEDSHLHQLASRLDIRRPPIAIFKRDASTYLASGSAPAFRRSCTSSSAFEALAGCAPRHTARCSTGEVSQVLSKDAPAAIKAAAQLGCPAKALIISRQANSPPATPLKARLVSPPARTATCRGVQAF